MLMMCILSNLSAVNVVGLIIWLAVLVDLKKKIF